MDAIQVLELIDSLRQRAAKFGQDDPLTLSTRRSLLAALGMNFDNPLPFADTTEKVPVGHPDPRD